MSVPVVWLSLNPDAIARGYWDDALLEDLFDRSAWRPAGALTFEHYEQRGDRVSLDADGAVVVLPARHHADQVGYVNTLLATFRWCLLVLTGDEENLFPVTELDHPNLRVWGMNRQSDEVHRVIPTGYTPDTPEILAQYRDEAFTKPDDWAFAGQITHPTRKECANVLRDLPNGTLIETESFTAGLERKAYLQLLAGAKLAPCPSGPVISDTFRLAEALEAGCVPIVDSPVQLHAKRVTRWPAFPKGLDQFLAEWPQDVVTAGAWWAGYKRELAYALDADVRALSGIEATADPLTVIIPTSPIAAHPSTTAIETVIQSLRERLDDTEIVIVADGVRPEQEDRRAGYLEYLRRLLWLCAHEWHNVLCTPLPEWGHQANATRAALDHVHTSNILFVEHDTPLVNDLPWRELCAVIDAGEANVIRLHHEASVLEPHRHLMLDTEPRDIAGVPLLRTVQWSQRPHIANVGWYRWMLAHYFPPTSRTMIEDRVHGEVVRDWHEFALAGWDRWRLWMYAPDGDIQRSTHLDTRGAASKYEMSW